MVSAVGIAPYRSISERIQGYHDALDCIFDGRSDRSVKFYLGRIILETGQRKSQQRTEDVEAAIIYYHHNFEGILEANVRNTSSYSGQRSENQQYWSHPTRNCGFPNRKRWMIETVVNRTRCKFSFSYRFRYRCRSRSWFGLRASNAGVVTNSRVYSAKPRFALTILHS